MWNGLWTLQSPIKKQNNIYGNPEHANNKPIALGPTKRADKSSNFPSVLRKEPLDLRNLTKNFSTWSLS